MSEAKMAIPFTGTLPDPEVPPRRSERKGRARIPGALWAAAGELARSMASSEAGRGHWLKPGAEAANARLYERNRLRVIEPAQASS